MKDFLKKHYVDDLFHSHVSMIEPKGKFRFGRDNLEQFWNIYCNLMYTDPKNTILGLAEKPGSHLPIFADFDIKLRLTDDLDVSNEHLYTEKNVKETIGIFQSVLRTIVEGCTDENLLCVLLEKPIYSVKRNNGKEEITYLKNGYHLHWPCVFLKKTDIEVHLLPRVKNMLKELKVFENLGLEDSSEPLDDKAVNVPWLIYGSRKEGMEPYLMTKIYDSDCEEIDFEEAFKYYQIFDINENLININNDGHLMKYLPRILSINPHHRQINEIKHGIISPLKEQQNNKKSNSNKTNEKKVLRVSVQDDIKMARKLLPFLSQARCENYAEWMEIGWVLYNIGDGSDEALDLWIEFSERDSEKFDEDVCILEWSKMVKKEYTIGTLKYYVSIDNPSEYLKFKYEEGQQYVKDSIQGSHYDVAKILYNEFCTEFICASISNRTWYQFVNHKWEEIEEGVFLRNHISTDIVEKYSSYGGTLFQQQAACDKAEEKTFQERIKQTHKMISNLKSAPYKCNIMKEAADLFYDKLFYRKLDTNPYLIAFQNGVYDLNKNEFRSGKPEDYLSKAMPINYHNFSETDPRVFAVYDFLEKVFPDKSVRQYFLDQASDIFVGGNQQKVVLFWTGDGDNGKSVTQNIFEKMLGDYAIKFSTTLLTGKKVANGAANPELARAGGGVRWAVLEEPDGDEEINIGYLKTLSGDDSYFVRDLFEKGKQTREIKPLFKLIFICLAGETKVSLSSGVSVSLENMIKNKSKLLSWDSEQDGLININQNAFIDKGIQQCITLTLLDGRQITCTPNHKFLTSDNNWVEAKDIKLNSTKLKMGVDYPKSDDIFNDYDYVLNAGEFNFNLRNFEDRVKIGAFSRLLGYSLADDNKSFYIENQIDCDNINNDISLFTDKKQSFSLSEELKKKFPNFLFDEKCPVFVIVEFIAGAFGVQGIITDKYSNLQFHGSISLIIKELLERLNIKSRFHNTSNLYLNITNEDSLKFCDIIGARYNSRLSHDITIVSSYLRYKKNNEHKLQIMNIDEFMIETSMNQFNIKSENSFLPCYEMSVIKSESVGEKQVYDLNVDEPYSNFIAEGIVTHNCNKLPRLKHADKATFNRVKVIPFESTFVRPGEPCPATYEEQLREKRFPMDREFSKKIPEIVEAFAWVLLQHRQKITIRIEPEKVRAATSMYQKQNDRYRQFIEEKITAAKDRYLELNELNNEFKLWYKDAFPGSSSSIPDKNEIKEYFIKIWGDLDKGFRWKGYKIKEMKDLMDNGEACEVEFGDENNGDDGVFEIDFDESDYQNSNIPDM